jgi:DNA polymerase (family 10)
MVNQEISGLFAFIADALEFKEENRFRVLAYRRGAEAVADLDEDVTVLLYEKRLTKVPGIGKGLAADIAEYLSTHRMSAYDRAMEGVPKGLLELKEISGLGPKRMALLHRELGVKDLWSLEKAMDGGLVAGLPGLGPKVVENLRRGIQRFAQSRERMTIGEALALSLEVLSALGEKADVTKAVYAGSLRRCRETCGDLDLLVSSRSGARVVKALTSLPGVERVLAAGDTKGSVLFTGGRQVDLRVVPAKSFGAALCYFTGSKDHNVKLREIAKKKGLKVNEYGVFRGETSIAGKTEREVYEALDLPWIPPEMRENRGEIEAAREGRLPDVVKEKDIRGDLHVHTNWSNGSADIAAMAHVARERGYKYVAVTDHSEAATYANGLSYERWKEQAKAIAAARESVDGITILHGTEADITEDGGIDLPAEAHERPDWIVAGIHSGFRKKATERVLRAMENPHVDAIAHPTGRLIGRRAEYEAYDLDAVIDKAAETGTALELNASPDRLDLSAEHARRAAGKGVRVVINSGAHDPAALGDVDLGVRVARRGWLTKKDVLNAGPVSRIRKGKARK